VTLLPETEVLRKELEKEVVGQRITAVFVRSPAVLPAGSTPNEFVKALEGRAIEAVVRRGTSLALKLKEGGALIVRPGSVATLTRHPAEAGVDEHAEMVRLVLEFDGGDALHYLDAEQNGALRLVTTEELDTSPELMTMGMDPLTQSPTWRELSRQLAIRNCRLRGLLGDETFVVGLGDVYSDEILWAAGLSGMRMSSKLSAQEVRRLYRAIQEVLHEAVKHGGGASEPAEEGEDPFDDPLANQHLKVYGRDGQACARCRQKIVFARIDDPPVPSYFCPNCQT
jgi:formamidopyrimidine-DNA glycosylase